MSLPTRDELRADLARFDEMQKKVVGGVLAVMFRSPDRVRDREWIVEQFTQVALLTGEFEAVEHAHEGVDVAQRWVREHIDVTLNACYALFLHVADDLSSRDETERTPSEAMLQALTYFG
ncbi:MAG: hypothetical protein AAGI22_12670 [Planctomycetota bacterium]